MKIFMAFLLLLFTFTAQAGDSGHYFDSDRNGEGLMMFRSGDTVQINFFTYKDWQGCPGINIPFYTLLTEENCHFNRWFISAGDTLQNDSSVTGALYQGFGFDYPDGLPVFGDPFAVIVGDAFKVGTFTLQRFEDGWRMSVERYGSILQEDDSLFHTIFHFTTPLILGTD